MGHSTVDRAIEARLEAMLGAAGATRDEVAAAGSVDELIELSIDVGVRPAGDPLTIGQLATLAGLTLQRAQELCRSAGLSPDDLEQPQWFTSDAEWLMSIEVAIEMFGEEATLSLIRRAGSMAAQMAHGSASVFRVGTYTSDQRELRPEEAAQRNLSISPLVDRYLSAFAQIYRHHTRASVRNESVAAGTMGEMRDLCVGFVDITSSSHLGERVNAHQLAALVTDFERAAYGSAAAHSARVVKTIGDEVMLCADDADAVVRAALTLVAWCESHPTFVGARGGIARGPLLDQAGDCYGPVVNRAARFVQAAPDGAVMVDDAVADELEAHPDFATDRCAPATHRGLGSLPWSEATALPA